MPEFADVEGYRRYLARYAKGKRVSGVEAPAADLIRRTTDAGHTAYWCPRCQRRS